MCKVLFILLILLKTNAQAEIFTWKDSNKVSHYANSIYDVPERYKDRAKKLDLGIEDKSDKAQQKAAESGGSQQQPITPVVTSPVIPAPPLPQELLVPPSKSLKNEGRKSGRSSKSRTPSSKSEE